MITKISISNSRFPKKSLGFTLIELLVVISIIGILTAFGAARYLTAERQARDTQRKSDLSQYRLALENYSAAGNALFPTPTCGSVENLCNFVIGASNFKTIYLSGACLQDPRPATAVYRYCSDELKYVLTATLETGGYYQVCSDGRSGKIAGSTLPPDAGGACSVP